MKYKGFDVPLKKIAEKIKERRIGTAPTILEELAGNGFLAILMVSSECNIRCKHCYLPYKNSRTPEDTFETVLKLQDAGHKAIIAGSENLMNPGYLKSYQLAGQKNILTNGLILRQYPSLYEHIRKHGIELITFSLHFGLEKELKSVPEKIVAEIIKETKHRNFLTQITTTITSKNYQNVEEMCEKASSYGVDRFYLGRFIAMGEGEKNQDLKLTDLQVKEFFARLNEARKIYSHLEIHAEGYFGPREGSWGELLAEANCYCPAGLRSVAIDPDNNLYGCPFTMGKDHIIGKFEDGIIKIDPRLVKERLGEKRDTCIAHLIY